MAWNDLYAWFNCLEVSIAMVSCLRRTHRCGSTVELVIFVFLFVDLVVFPWMFRRSGGFFVDVSSKWWFVR